MLDVNADIHEGLQVKYPSFLADFNPDWKVSTNFSKTAVQNFMKIHSVAEVVACRQTAGRHGEAKGTFLQCFM
jgi:hypothetical protein